MQGFHNVFVIVFVALDRDEYMYSIDQLTSYVMAGKQTIELVIDCLPILRTRAFKIPAKPEIHVCQSILIVCCNPLGHVAQDLYRPIPYVC